MPAYITLPNGSRCYSGPNCLRHGQRGLPADFANKPVAEQLKDMERLKNPLSAETPKDIDDRIASLYNTYYGVIQDLKMCREKINEYTRMMNRSPDSRRASYEENITYFQNKIDAINAEGNEVLQEIVPYEVEYTRRPWTRAFLVVNNNGHVHKNRSCSTCQPSTRFAWLTQYSGKDEDGIVEDAGEKACTVCYPSAPVEVLNRPSRIRTEADEARAVRAAERAERERIREAKSIQSPDGTPLRTRYSGRIDTLVSAEQYASALYADMKAVERGDYEIRNPEYHAEKEESYAVIMKAIASKKGVSVQQAFDDLEGKFERKYKKEWRS